VEENKEFPRTFIDDNNPNERLQHLSDKPNALITLMVHHRLIASTRRTLPGTRARTGCLLLAFSLVIPSQKGAARLARLEAEIKVVVLQVGQHARLNDPREGVPGKVERLQGI